MISYALVFVGGIAGWLGVIDVAPGANGSQLAVAGSHKRRGAGLSAGQPSGVRLLVLNVTPALAPIGFGHLLGAGEFAWRDAERLGKRAYGPC